jgi:hypothetical protein
LLCALPCHEVTSIFFPPPPPASQSLLYSLLAALPRGYFNLSSSSACIPISLVLARSCPALWCRLLCALPCHEVTSILFPPPFLLPRLPPPLSLALVRRLPSSVCFTGPLAVLGPCCSVSSARFRFAYFYIPNQPKPRKVMKIW